ncbi:hypothetical protein KRR40_25020 [Niabella defluvii]|nr:hypothetical protein KRR40_25020 [Niabella sp. I65]
MNRHAPMIAALGKAS